MTTLYLAGVDVEAEFPGILLASVPDVLDRARTMMPEATIPGLAGSYGSGPLEVPSKEFTFGIVVDAVSVAATRDLFEALVSLCGTHVITVRLVDRSDLLIYARLQSAKFVGDFPSLVSTSATAELVFKAEYPYWRELSAVWYGFGSSYVQIPLLNAPTAPLIELWGPATQPLDLVLANSSGVVLRTSRFTLPVADTSDYVRIYTEAWGMSIWKSLDGVVTQDDTLLDSNYLFPKHLEPFELGNPYLSQWGLIKVTAAGGTPRGRIIYPKQVL